PAYTRQQFKTAVEEAQLRARKAIGEMIYGYYVQYRSVVSIRENRSIMETQLDKFALPMVKFSKPVGYNELGLVYITASVPKIAFVEAINDDQKLKTGQNLTPAQYQDLRFMFPDTITVSAFGACTKNPKDPGRKYIETIAAYKVEACVRLVNYLKGPTVSAISRLEDFFLTQDTIEATLPKTLVRNAMFCVSEPNKYKPADISLSIMITGSDWIFSVSSALEEKGQKLTPEEYLKLKTRFARYPDKYISYTLPDDVLNDPNDVNRPTPPVIPEGGTSEPPLGNNDNGDMDILWK
ncbi:MAG: hypothetical protein AABZ60_07055, partial [Planctomycetota bacterium]